MPIDSARVSKAVGSQSLEVPPRQGGLDREVRVLPLRASRARSVRVPGGDGRRGHPEGDVASTDQRAIIGGPVLDVGRCLVRGMDSRLPPSSLVCPLAPSLRSRAPTPIGAGVLLWSGWDGPWRLCREGIVRVGSGTGMTKDTGLAERMDESQEYFGIRMIYVARRDRVWTAVAKYLQRYVPVDGAVLDLGGRTARSSITSRRQRSTRSTSFPASWSSPRPT